MLKRTIKTTKDEGIVEIGQELLSDELVDRGSVHGYWRSPGDKTSEQHEPYFFMAAAARVDVKTRLRGKTCVSLNLYNESGHHGGPSFPQTGGSASLGPGQWRLYFTGWITSYPKPGSAVEVDVISSGIADLKLKAEPEAAVEEKHGQVFQVRAVGSSRPQAIRIAYRRADEEAAGHPFSVLEERVYAEGPRWVCILRCELT